LASARNWRNRWRILVSTWRNDFCIMRHATEDGTNLEAWINFR
jgi:hypothetical protein